MARVLVCAAWPYANGALHLGHIAGSLLGPDIFARYHRLKGDEVLMVSGSDQHGTPVTVKAEKEGVSAEEIAERYHRINSKAIKDLGIQFDLFTKTHNPHHYEVVHDVFRTLLENDYLYKKGTMQYFCPKEAKFLPDRYVEGTCKRCGNERARGDQCEKCGATYEAGELDGVRCTTCGTAPELRETEHFFFKLSAFQEPLLRYVQGMDHWRSNVKVFTQNWLEAGLKDRAITRDMSWGVPVPLEGWDGKVIYVWFEAVIGYLSASKEWAELRGTPDAWKGFWQDPGTKGYYFLGKDNIPFHTIIWPSMLMGYGGLSLPYDVPANEFLTFKGEAFSKSRGVGADVPSLVERFDPDVIRYYIASNMPENRDTDFSLDDFEAKVNNELVATLGNYYHRVLSFTHKNFGSVPTFVGFGEEERMVAEAISRCRHQVDESISSCQFKPALKAVMDLAQFGNQFFDRMAPWALIKTDREKCGAALNLNLRIVRALALLSHAFLPFSSERLWAQLGEKEEMYPTGLAWMDRLLVAGTALPEPKPLFNRMVVEKMDDVFKEFETLNLKVGKVLEVRPHPNAEKLLVIDVDIGTKIQLVAGLRAYYPGEELKGKSIVVVSNLQPAKLRGVESMGMLLAAESGGKVKVLTPSGASNPGDPVNSGMAQGEKQISFSDFQKLTLRIGTASNGKVAIGREMELKAPKGASVSGKVAVYLPTPDAKVALPLVTNTGVAITVDGEIEDGAPVR
ncbi:MAG TPA: methionine--tRNA ligase [Methanomassiliicoccales archaeon]|nr:methionine--tRNA ligase [Methanomassiliicoccales archaeon]